jgi:hypothetical protein
MMAFCMKRQEMFRYAFPKMWNHGILEKYDHSDNNERNGDE